MQKTIGICYAELGNKHTAFGLGWMPLLVFRAKTSVLICTTRTEIFEKNYLPHKEVYRKEMI